MTDNKTTDNKTEGLSFKEFIRQARARWKWYAISFAFVFSLTALYLISATRLYTRSVEILLKTDESQYMTADLESLGVKPVNSDLLDEMYIITSPAVLETATATLSLNDSYTGRKGLRKVNLYGVSPFAVTIPAENTALPTDGAFSMKVKVMADSTFAVSSFRYQKKKYTGTWTIRSGESFDSPAGPIKISATPHYNAEAIGSTVGFSHIGIKRYAELLREEIKTDYDEESASVITLSIRSSSVSEADDILRAVVNAYTSRWLNDRNKVASSTSRFIEERLANIESDLAAVEGKITDYQSRNTIVDMNAAATMYLQQSDENKKALDEIARRIATVRYLKSMMTDGDLSRLLPPMADADGSRLPELIKDYNELVADRNLRLKSMDENSPLLAGITAAVTDMRRAITQTLDQTLDILNDRLKALRLTDAGTTGKLSKTPGQTRYLMSEDRKQKVMESLYVYLLQRREENELSQAFTAYNTRMVTDPFGPPEPTSPRIANILLIAFALALLMPSVMIYMREVTNTKVRSRADLDSLSVPYIGEIPSVNSSGKRWQKADDEARKLLVRPKHGDVVNEAFRMVRTNLEFMRKRNDEGGSETIMIVSLAPNSGKTFVSLNLAAVFAIKNKRVCVVDMDLRRGSLSKTAGSPRHGLTDLLMGSTDLDSMIVHNVDGIEGLDILPEGVIPPNPTELLFSDRLEQIMAELRQRYDVVILDCPPVEAVSDARVINRFADLTVFVVRSGSFERSQLPLLQGYYDSKRYTNMAVLLNDTPELHGSYGRYGYGYSSTTAK